MLPAFVLLVSGPIAREGGSPRVSPTTATCAMAKAESWVPGRAYVVQGTYFADGMHGADVEIDGCDALLVPELIDDAAAKVAAFHTAFATKCGGNLIGDGFSGKLTGTFVRRRVRLFGWSRAATIPIFVIRDVAAEKLAVATISCPADPAPVGARPG